MTELSGKMLDLAEYLYTRLRTDIRCFWLNKVFTSLVSFLDVMLCDCHIKGCRRGSLSNVPLSSTLFLDSFQSLYFWPHPTSPLWLMGHFMLMPFSISPVVLVHLSVSKTINYTEL